MKEAKFPDTLAAQGHLRIFLLNQQTEGVVCEREVRSRDEYFHHTPQGWRVRMKEQVEEELAEMAGDPSVRFYLDNNLPLTLELHLGVGSGD